MRPAFRSGRLRKWPYVIDCNHVVAYIIKLKAFSFGLNTINKLGPLIRSEVRMRDLFRAERGSGLGFPPVGFGFIFGRKLVALARWPRCRTDGVDWWVDGDDRWLGRPSSGRVEPGESKV